MKTSTTRDHVPFLRCAIPSLSFDRTRHSIPSKVRNHGNKASGTFHKNKYSMAGKAAVPFRRFHNVHTKKRCFVFLLSENSIFEKIYRCWSFTYNKYRSTFVFCILGTYDCSVTYHDRAEPNTLFQTYWVFKKVSQGCKLHLEPSSYIISEKFCTYQFLQEDC